MSPFVKCTMDVQVISTMQKTLMQQCKTPVLIDSSSPSLVATISKVLALMCLALGVNRDKTRLNQYFYIYFLEDQQDLTLRCSVCPTHFTR